MGEDRKVYRVLVGKSEGKEQLEEYGVDGRMGSEWILGRLAGGVEGIQLAQERGWWWDPVNTARNLWVLAPQSWCVTVVYCQTFKPQS
jgi:hypothetical protein